MTPVSADMTRDAGLGYTVAAWLVPSVRRPRYAVVAAVAPDGSYVEVDDRVPLDRLADVYEHAALYLPRFAAELTRRHAEAEDDRPSLRGAP